MIEFLQLQAYAIEVLRVLGFILLILTVPFIGILGIQFMTFLLFRHHFGAEQGERMYGNFNKALDRGLNGPRRQ